jgi:hypothetical protein
VPLETAGLEQKAVYWEATGLDRKGRYTISDVPVELNVRWVKTQRQGTDARGTPVAITADVQVDRYVPPGSVMWEGGLDDLPGTALVPESDVMRVASIKETPDIKGIEVHRILSLYRASDSLPTST